jgi:hypothetical protein
MAREEEITKVGCGCLAISAQLVFYGTLIYLIIHFAHKYW